MGSAAELNALVDASDEEAEAERSENPAPITVMKVNLQVLVLLYVSYLTRWTVNESMITTFLVQTQVVEGF